MSVLDVRLASIERHLEQAQDPERWLSKLSSDTGDALSLWEFAFDGIQTDAVKLERRIEDLRRGLADGSKTEADAWADYQTIRLRTEAVLRECLDLLGGLALRDRATDDSICQLADDLISEFAQPWFRVVATVPALSDDNRNPLTSTLRRVASVRFPDWSLWTVPLVAHEYAAVMTEVEDILRDYVRSASTAWVLAHPQATSEEADELSTRAAGYARVLLADAFATFAMGPAYACPAVLLRLDPAVGGHRYRPSDATRARVVLGVLEAMDTPAFGAYGSMLDSLNNQWQTMSGLSVRPPVDELGDMLSAADVADYLHRRFKHKKSGYPAMGWGEAGKWSTAWKDALRNRRAPVPPQDVKGHSLRDALNAIWDTRVWINDGAGDPAVNDLWVGQVEAVGKQLCSQLVPRRSGTAKKLPKSSRVGVRG